MDNKTPKLPEAPAGRSIVDDRIKLFDTDAIACASTLGELKSAIQGTLVKLSQFDEVMLLKELQSVASSLRKNPNSSRLQGELNEKFIKAQKKTAVRSGEYALGSVHYQDADYFQTVRQDFIDEYKATSASELLVIDMVVVAYFRYMRTTSAFNSFIEDNDGRREYESQTWINMMKELNKAISSASQQMTTALTFLKELKRQPVQVKVHAKQAYFANNQQINEHKP